VISGLRDGKLLFGYNATWLLGLLRLY
jgi:hypothetical protein